MDLNAVLVEAAFTFGKYADGRNLDSSGAEMFNRVFDLTVRTALARDPGQWKRKSGRTYVLVAIARIAREAAKLAGSRRVITGPILRRAADGFVTAARQKVNARVSVAEETPFCFAYQPGAEVRSR